MANNTGNTFIDLDDYVTDDDDALEQTVSQQTTLGPLFAPHAAAAATGGTRQKTAPNFKDQIRDTSVPIVSAYAVEVDDRRTEEEEERPSKSTNAAVPPAPSTQPLTQSLHSSSRPEDGSSNTTTSKKWMVGVGVVVLVVLVAVGVIFGTGSSDSEPSQEPVNSPTTTISRSESIVNYINSITLSGRRLTYPNTNFFAEEQALTWLVVQDLGTSPTDERKLRQRFALATVWYANGPFEDAIGENHLGTWLTSRDECTWFSLADCVDGEVTSVGFFDDGLKGQLPSDVGLFTALTSLWLLSNRLTGTIPTEIGLLRNLDTLNFASNQLTGTIPAELNQLSILMDFQVYNTDLSGNMPFCNGSTRPTRFLTLLADCNEVSCPCCTRCCPNGGFGGVPSVSNDRCDA